MQQAPSTSRSASYLQCSTSSLASLPAQTRFSAWRRCQQHSGARRGSSIAVQADAVQRQQQQQKPAPSPEHLFANKETYNDNAFDKFMISYFSKRMSEQLGGLPYKAGFEGFVELSKEMMRGRNSPQQQQTVAGVLESLLPPDAPRRFRSWFPFSKFTAEANAWITTVGFAWLVGEMELQKCEVEKDGSQQTWTSGVKIKKCRYLEATACAGICTNLCKLPTQSFFTETFGLPLLMEPNFEDLSCEMKFGVMPPPVEQDPVYNQPCYSVCEIAQEGRARACHRVDTERKKKGLSDAAVPASEAAHLR